MSSVFGLFIGKQAKIKPNRKLELRFLLYWRVRTSLKFARRILPEVTVAAKKAGLPSAEDLNHEKQPGGGF
jgi:hypothetical protein